jgi:uncharacterized protein YjbI with pentapeptide repeats
MGLAASGLITTAIADARVVDGCDLKPETVCDEMVLPFVGGLVNEDLTGASFRRSDLSGAYIERTTLVDANLTETVLNDVTFLYSSLAGAKLSKSSSTSIDFGGLSLTRASFRDVTFGTSTFTAVNATFADFTGAEMPFVTIKPTPERVSIWENVNFTGAILTDARIRDTKMFGSSLANADLSRASLSSVQLFESNLSNANLSFTTLSSMHLGGARLGRALLVDSEITGADFTDADIEGLNVQDSTIRGASFTLADGSVRFSFTNMTGQAAPESGSYFMPNSMVKANLRGSTFENSDLRGVDFSRSDLRNVDFTGSNIRTAIFDGADMRGVTLPDSALAGRPAFGCNKRTRWSGDYAERFRAHCRGKGDRVKPLWCNDEFERNQYLCALCGRICIGGRDIDQRAEIVPTACELRHEGTLGTRLD